MTQAAGACVGREFLDRVLVANFGGRCQQFLGVAKFVANSSTYCTYESCPTHHSLSFQQVRLCQQVGQAMGLHGELGRRGVRNV